MDFWYIYQYEWYFCHWSAWPKYSRFGPPVDTLLGFWAHRNTKFESPEKECILAIFREKKEFPLHICRICELEHSDRIMNDFYREILSCVAREFPCSMKNDTLRSLDQIIVQHALSCGQPEHRIYQFCASSGTKIFWPSPERFPSTTLLWWPQLVRNDIFRSLDQNMFDYAPSCDRPEQCNHPLALAIILTNARNVSQDHTNFQSLQSVPCEER